MKKNLLKMKTLDPRELMEFNDKLKKPKLEAEKVGRTKVRAETLIITKKLN